MKDNNTVKIVQITDTHLFESDHSPLYDTILSNNTFDSVLQRIKAEDIADTDMIFLTGDITQDETEGSYQRVANALQDLNMPICWIPGNHDNISIMEKIFSQSSWFMKPLRLSAASWEFIFLNTKMENDVTGVGILTEHELQRLDKQLKLLAHDNKPIAIVMHHPPLKVNTPLVDSSMLSNHTEFWNMIAGSNVKLIISGHVHNNYQMQYKDVCLETSPATCVQYVKGSTKLEVEKKIGYKIYYFEDDQYFAKAKLW